VKGLQQPMRNCIVEAAGGDAFPLPLKIQMRVSSSRAALGATQWFCCSSLTMISKTSAREAKLKKEEEKTKL